MSRHILVLLTVSFAAGLFAHPMGNFSVNHFAKLTVTDRGVRLNYVVDLAEIPTFELLRDWNLERGSPRPDLDREAGEQARTWLGNLKISSNGKPAKPRFESANLVIGEGGGNLPIIRISTQAFLEAPGGTLAYDDLNYPDRAGWKEIVIENGPGAVLRKASQTNKDSSEALTQYPPDPAFAPPQDLRAELEWAVDRSPVAKPVIAPIPQPKRAPAASSPAKLTPQSAPPGAVVRGDTLSALLRRGELMPWMILTAMAVAFGLGAAHALTPGHGKTIVAAYLVGSRGTVKHAAFLGAMVTFTHTISVFAVGLVTLFLFRYVVPERVTQALGVISGLSIVAIGGWMLYKRFRGAAHAHAHSHGHDHAHHHDHEHAHVHAGQAHPHHHTHDPVTEVHHHGPGGHTHVPEELSWAGLVALGVSGGLVPCESALVLLLSAIALGRVGLGLLLLVSFSLGLALVLMMIGILVLYAKSLLPERSRTGHHPLFRWIPVASAAVVMVVGLLMTAVSAGWIQPKWMIG